MTPSTWSIRRSTSEDAPYVADTWLGSYQEFSVGGRGLRIPYLKNINLKLRGIASDAYFQHHSPLINELLDRATILVAHDPQDTGYILGWICGEVHATGCLVIHYVYTRGKHRNGGVARDLVYEMITQLSSKVTDPQIVVSSITPSVRMQIDRRGYVLVDKAAFTLRAGRRD